MKLTSKLIILLFAFTLAGCGGGGSSSSGDTSMNMPETEDMCPSGQTGTPPNCVDPVAEQMARDAEAMRVGGALGGTTDDPNAGVMHVINTPMAPNGKVMTGTTAGSLMDDASASYTGITGWKQNAYVMTSTNAPQKVSGVLYNNVQAPTAAMYSTYFITNNVPFVSTPADDDGMITFSTGLTDYDPAVHGDKFESDDFPSGPNRFVVFADNEETQGVNEREIAGSFYGIDGTFECTSSSCRVETNADGVLASATGDWTFTPTKYTAMGTAATMVQGVVADPDYMVFGYWLDETTTDGKVTYAVRVYQGGPMPSTTLPAEGTAKYEGPATGMYMTKSFDPDTGEPTSPFASGQFTAKAMLTATFGAPTSVAQDDHNSITGTISGFMDSNGVAIDESWELELGKQASGAGNIDGTSAIVLSETSGYENGSKGEWQGTFYGTPDETPGSVGGTFNGHFRNGHVAGAFGATKTSE